MVSLSQHNKVELTQIIELLYQELALIKSTQTLAEELNSLVDSLPDEAIAIKKLTEEDVRDRDPKLDFGKILSDHEKKHPVIN
jgi:hypothetical protein